MIAIIDYGMGNVGSIRSMLRAAGSDGVITADPTQIVSAEKIILPGVGAFDTGMRNLMDAGLIELLEDAVIARRVPLLGICLGMQLMCKSSEEGKLAGLGWINATIRRFNLPAGSALKIPHMGWNTVKMTKFSPLFSAQQSEQRFYFVHSYHAVCESVEDVLATACHGYDFVAAFNRDNVYGVQFHPEKSHRFGKALITAFVAL